jgi:predicted transcriptional regulator of viral defense system
MQADAVRESMHLSRSFSRYYTSSPNSGRTDLTTQSPFEVWMAIDNKSWRSTRSDVSLRIHYFSGRALTGGVEHHEINGVQVKIYGAAKTVADCFKFRNKIGIDVAIEALREYLRKRMPEKTFGDMRRSARYEMSSILM